MDKLKLEATEETPEITLDQENNVFEMTGRSLPEDATEFYQPVLEWLEQYGQNPNQETPFTFNLEYFNTASSKLLLDVLTKLEEIDNSKVLWYYDGDDEDMQEAGEEFSEIVDVPFEFYEK